MKLRLRLLVERHRDGRTTASVLGLPAAAAGGGAGPSPVRGLPAAEARREATLPPVSPLAGHGDDLEALKLRLAERAAEAIVDTPPARLAEWRFHPEQRLERVAVPVTAVDWTDEPLEARGPFEVEMAIVVTTMPRPPHAVLVPRLGFSIAVDDPAGAAALARAEIAAYLQGRPGLRRLDALFALLPAREERLDVLEVEAPTLTPLEVERTATAASRRERGEGEGDGDGDAGGGGSARADAAVLESVATDLGAAAREGGLGVAHEAEALVEEVLGFLAGSDEKAILLVGPSGAGKTAALHEAIRRRPRREADPAPVWHVTGARLVAGMSGLGDWEERCRAVVATARRTRAVLSVGDPNELVEQGQAVGFDVSIAQYLKGPIERGWLRVVGECTEEGLLALERRDRGFAALFRVIRVPEADRARSLAVLGRVEAALRAAGGRPVAPAALEVCHDLHARFAPYRAFPGKAVRFLRRVAREGRGGATSPLLAPPAWPSAHEAGGTRSLVDRGEMTRAFARATGLPEVVLADDLPLDPDAARAFLRERVIGQDGATALVAELLARVRAGVADPRRPLGSFLFLGPTGVGKTETAKALAELLFGRRTRLVRLDMTEYGDGWAAARLTGGTSGEGEGDLTRPVRAEPLSVVLLDEVEKAHPGVFDLLLQVLGDARLTDAAGRVTDFRSTIVILTSNLGAEMPEGALGFGGGADRGAPFIAAAEAFFRPELLNRLDAIVPFDPLGPEVVRAIARREVAKALARDGLERRGVRVEAAPALVDAVVAAGFDPRYGARPLKRAVERLLVRPLAHHLTGRVEVPRRLLVEPSAGAPGEAAGRAVDVPAAAGAATAGGDGDALDLVKRVAGQRREAAGWLASDLADDIRDELATETALARPGPGPGPGPAPAAHAVHATPEGRERAGRSRRLAAAIAALEKAQRAAEELEELAALCLLGDDPAGAAALQGDADALEREVSTAVFQLLATQVRKPDAAVVAVAPLERDGGLAQDLIRLYDAFATAHGFRVLRFAEGRAPPPGAPPTAPVLPTWFEVAAFPAPGEAADARVARPTGAFAAIVMGENAGPYLAGEAGRHRHLQPGPAVRDRGERFALVRVEEVGHGALPGLHTIPFPGEGQPRGIPAELPPVVRIYDERETPPNVRDPRTNARVIPVPFARAVAAVAPLARAWLVALATGSAPASTVSVGSASPSGRGSG